MQWNDLIGARVGPYRILEEIGRGGSGRVYKALHEADERLVAMKVILNDAEDALGFVRRFERELQLVARLHHPNIVAVYDSGQYQDLIYLVMRYINGGTLRQRMGRALPVGAACAAMMQMCHALQHAHEAKIIHRDVKPSNMLVALDDGGRLLLTDFGIAKIQGLRGLTKSGTTIGTPEYMAPEQAEGREVDCRADVYSLGCVLYEALAGRPPFVAANPVSVLYRQVHTRPDYIRSLNPTVTRDLARVVERALAKRPQERFESAESFARALAPFAQGDNLSLAALPIVQPATVGATARTPGAASIAPRMLAIQRGGVAALPFDAVTEPSTHAGESDAVERDARSPDEARDPGDTNTEVGANGHARSTRGASEPADVTRRGAQRTRRRRVADTPVGPTRRRLALAGGAVAAALVVGALAWMAATAMGVGIAGRGPQATLTAPASTTSAPTATVGPEPTATLTTQQRLDEQAQAAFRAITVASVQDSSCAAANNRASFSSSQYIHFNLCLASSAGPGRVTIVLRQGGGDAVVVTRNAPVDPHNSSWNSFFIYVPSGAYDALITYNGGTAADIAITVQ